MKPAFIFCWCWIILVSHPLPGQAQEPGLVTSKRNWYLPDQAVVQFAGNIGLFSAGPGYILKRGKINLDFLYGYTPSFEAETSIHTVTLKFTYSRWHRKVAPVYIWEPFKFGLGISYSLGSQFYTTLPKRYPDGYYFWPTSFRLTPFISTSLSKAVGTEYTLVKRVQAYGEIGTHDLAILSIINNKALKPWDIISFALGARFIL
jgi:hypothetical protein